MTRLPHFSHFSGEECLLAYPPNPFPPSPRQVMAKRGITHDGYVVEHFTLYQKSNLRALNKAFFFILPYLNVVSWNIFQLGGPFWGLVVVKLS